MQDSLARVQLLAAGEALIDLVEQPDGSFHAHAGGAAYNLARAMALQGVDTAYLNRLSDDRFGARLAEGLREAGVQMPGEPVRQPTSLAVVQLDAQGKAGYGFYREGVADRVDDAQALIERSGRFDALRAVCTGALALLPEDRSRYLPWLQHARAQGWQVVVDANLRPAAAASLPAYRDSVRAALALAHLVKASDEDLQVLLPDVADPLAAARTLFALGPVEAVALTRGAEGATLLARDGRTWHARETASLRIADTVGAGDCFLAGLLTGLLADGVSAGSHWSDETARSALARAVSSASLCVQRAGCNPPRGDEVAPWLARGSVAVSAAVTGG